MFFVLSTGRSGSMTIAQTLSALPGVTCLHEPDPPLIEEARAYLTGRMTKPALVELLRSTRPPRNCAARYGESNQKLSYMIDALQEAFPEAVYIWLIRNGMEVVASYHKRRIYRDDIAEDAFRGAPWADHRIRGDEAGAMTKAEWQGRSAFAQCCWYWNWTNRKIQRDLNALGAPWMMVRLEDLAPRIGEVVTFLGERPDSPVEVPLANRSRLQLTKPCWWDRSQRATFDRECGALMDEVYPGWRTAIELPWWPRCRNEALSYLSTRRATGRALRKLLRPVPRTLRAPVRRLLKGRGVLEYE